MVGEVCLWLSYMGNTQSEETTWPLQDIRLLQSFNARANHPLLAPPHLHCPHYCNAIARRLRNTRSPLTTLLNGLGLKGALQLLSNCHM